MEKPASKTWQNPTLIAAWLVHIFTASGAVVGILALYAIQQGDPRGTLAWLFFSFAIDAVDGSLARAARVGEVLPDIDGRMLDYVIDFANIVFIPAYFLYVTDLLPESTQLWFVAALLLSSCYHYANRRALSEDFFFEGFPAMWNIVVFYLFFLGLSPLWNAILVVFFCAIHFIPIKFVYPTRTHRLQILNLGFVGLSSGCNLFLLYSYPQQHPWVLALSIGGIIYLGGFSLLSTLKRVPTETTALQG